MYCLNYRDVLSRWNKKKKRKTLGVHSAPCLKFTTDKKIIGIQILLCFSCDYPRKKKSAWKPQTKSFHSTTLNSIPVSDFMCSGENPTSGSSNACLLLMPRGVKNGGFLNFLLFLCGFALIFGCN